jgi:hypothetical protein
MTEDESIRFHAIEIMPANLYTVSLLATVTPRQLLAQMRQ